MPYITASIILQLLTVVWPYLEKLSKEGRARTAQDHAVHPLRHGGLSVIQSTGIAVWLEKVTAPGGAQPRAAARAGASG